MRKWQRLYKCTTRLVQNTMVLIESTATRDIRIGHCRHYHIEVDRDKNSSWRFAKTFRSIFWPWDDLHTPLLSLVDKRLASWLIIIAVTVAMFRNVSTEYHCDRTVDGDETNFLLVHCKHYYLEVFLRRNIRAALFAKNSAGTFLPSEHFHTVIATVVGKWLRLCFSSTAVTVPMLNNVCTEYHCDRTVDGDETKFPLVFSKHYHMEVFSEQNFRADFLTKSSAQISCLRLASMWYGPQCRSGCVFCLWLTTVC